LAYVQKGAGVAADTAQALFWLRKAASAGYVPAKEALHSLGIRE